MLHSFEMYRMVQLAIALMMFVCGMAPAISCEVPSEMPIQVASLDSSCSRITSSRVVTNQSNPSSDQEDSQSLPCTFCSSFCHHTVTLPSSADVLPLLGVASFFDFPVDGYSSVHLESPKEPPRSS